MTKQLTVILLLTGHVLFAQNKPQPTQFDRFVNNPKIEWAAYASDSFNFSAAGLNMRLLNRLAKKEIKASLPVESRTVSADQFKYTILDSIDNAFYGSDEDMMMDSLGSVITKKRPISQKDSSNFKLTELTQVLYVEKGILKSYIPFITPTLPVVTSSGQYIGERFYFTTCFNYKYNSKAGKKSSLIFLMQTKKMIKLNPETNTAQLKEMYGHNLLETLWPYVLQNKIETFSFAGNRKLNAEELNNELAADQPVNVPIYDSSGNTVGTYKVVSESIDPQRFTDLQLVQDWYYDARKNKVFSYVTEMVLYLNKPNKKEEMETVPVLRLVF